MQSEKGNGKLEAFIPVWMKMLLTVCAAIVMYLLFRAYALEPKSVYSSSATIQRVGLLFAVVLVPFWFFPTSRVSLFIYWLLGVLRGMMCMFALLGIVFMIIQVPAIVFRGNVSLLAFILVFIIGLLVRPVTLERLRWPGFERLSDPLQKLADKMKMIPPWLVSVLVAVLPIAIVCYLVYVEFHASLSDFRPYSNWNDETGYWLWIRSFSKAGLNVGYNAPNELTNPAAFNRYGEGSPLFVYIYGLVAQLVGWSDGLPLVINFVLLALAVFGFTRWMKFDRVQTLVTGLVTLLTWPILLYLPRTSHETLNQAIGFVFAGIFLTLLSGKTVGWRGKAIFVVFLYFATMIRLSWGLLAVPLIYLCLNGGVLRRAILSILLGGGLFLSGILLTAYLVPPVNNSIFSHLGELGQAPLALFDAFWSPFMRMWQVVQFHGKLIDPGIAVIFELFIVLGWCLVRLAGLIRARKPVTTIIPTGTALYIYLTASLIFAGFVFYLQAGFYRTFIPTLLVVLLMLVAQKDYRFVAALLVLQLAFFSSYASYFGNDVWLKVDFTRRYPELAQSAPVVEKYIVYDPAATDPWCNTVLIPPRYYDYHITVIPPGIGISYLTIPMSIDAPVKSNYLLFDQPSYDLLSDKLHVELLASTPIGNIYHNLDTDCRSRR